MELIASAFGIRLLQHVVWQPKIDPSREVVSGPLNRVTEMFECDIYCLEYVIMNVWKFQASI